MRWRTRMRRRDRKEKLKKNIREIRNNIMTANKEIASLNNIKTTTEINKNIPQNSQTDQAMTKPHGNKTKTPNNITTPPKCNRCKKKPKN